MANTPPALPLVAVEAVPPPPPPTAHVTIHSLPPELVHHIIKLALPRVRFDTFEERYKTLRACCLVSKAWNECARRELRQHTYLSEPAALQDLEATLELNDGLGELVRSLRLQGLGGWECEVVQPFMERLSRCTELWLCGGDHRFRLHLLNISAFASRIQRLHIDEASPFPATLPNGPITLPQLVELSLSDAYIEDQLDAVEFLQHADMPHLRSLGIHRWSADISGAVSPLLMAAINRLAPQLGSFSFIPSDLTDVTDPELDWNNFTKFTNLRTFAFPITTSTAQILYHIPSKLQALRLVNPPSEAEVRMLVLVTILKEWAPCMERLGRLVLPTGAESDDRCARLCLSKGVQEEYDAPDTGPSFWEDWEHSVLWWYATTSVSVAARR